MTPRQKKITATVTSTVIASLIVAALLGAVRHEQEQDKRATTLEGAHAADSISRVNDRAVLLRIDQRVSEMYCGSVPQSSRAGCR